MGVKKEKKKENVFFAGSVIVISYFGNYWAGNVKAVLKAVKSGMNWPLHVITHK